MFVTGFVTGMRLGEILSIKWPQVDFESGYIVLQTGETKNGEGRAVPILEGDMRNLLSAAKQERDTSWPRCQLVFSRVGEPIKDFRASWRQACVTAGVPELNFHDLRRTAVRNMRRAGIPQVVRMKISGHKTDSMERSLQHRGRRRFERCERAFGAPDEARECNEKCNDDRKRRETRRYRRLIRINVLRLHDTPRNSLKSFQVLVSARTWRFKSSHPHQ